MTICRICLRGYVPSVPEDRAAHRKRHLEMARGGMPLEVRDFMKAFGWAVAHDDGGLDRLKGAHDPELGKLVVAYAWWSRARLAGAPEKDFDSFMDAHLAFADALVSEDRARIAAAEKGIEKWGRYAG